MRSDGPLVVVRGGGDLASGVAFRLFRAGFRVIVTEIEQPTAVRRPVAFAEAVYAGETTVEGVTARRATSIDEAERLLEGEVIPVLIDPSAEGVRQLHPQAVVDAIMAKRNTGTSLSDASVVIGLGPGFTAGVDCHAVVETNRGHYLGRVITKGPASADTGVPGAIGGETERRILRAPATGIMQAKRPIGEFVRQGERVAEVGGEPVRSQLDGVLRGLLHDGLHVAQGTKLGDVDPRANPEHCFTISDKSMAIAGGVLEALMTRLQRQPWSGSLAPRRGPAPSRASRFRG